MLPARRSRDRQFRARQEIIGSSTLIEIGSQKAVSVKAPFAWDSCSAVRVPRPDTKQHRWAHSDPDVSALQRIPIAGIWTLSVRIEIVREQVVIEDRTCACHRHVTMSSAKVAA